MPDRLRLYVVIVGVTCFFAVGALTVAFLFVPLTGYLWPSIIHFALLCVVAELIAVNLREGEGTLLTPASPIIWAATCVLGPIPAVVATVGGALVSMLIRYVCYHLAQYWQTGVTVSKPGGLVASLRRMIDVPASAWQSRPLRVTLLMIGSYLSTMILEVSVSGLVYYLLGGEFLFSAGKDFEAWRGFAFPFLGLVVLSLAMPAIEYALITASVDPIPGTNGLSGFVLRSRLALAETAIPLAKGQLFLAVVALLLAYLYSQIGVLGFLLAITPVLALRDFFHQWVEERSAYLDTITSLATYMQHYHPYTRGHLKRVADMSERLARELRLPVESIRHMNTAAFLHDIGKIGVSEEILDKTTKLTDEEWDTIKEHPVKGSEIIGHLEFLDAIVDWIKYHHKWYDGRGYPDTNGENTEIPIEAAIIATADAFDAMTDDRELSLDWVCDSCGHKPENGLRPNVCPGCGAEKRRRYREPKSLDEAVDELRRGSGTQFHPKVVKAFLTMLERDGIRLNA